MTRTVAGRYELTTPVARGGMGEVWAGYDRRLDRAVAVKMLRPETLPAGTDLDALSRRFAREARMTARVEHRGVPAVHDAGVDDGDLFVVMQMVEGRNLADVIAEDGPLSTEWTAAIGAQVAAILAVAHDVSLVHRDLKPRNIMLSSNGAVTVLDFGVAAILESSVSRLTTTGETLGSPAYMAPEQALEGKAGPRSDLYALGCVLYELRTGSPVFGSGQPLAIMQRHLVEPPPSLHHVSAPLSRVVEELLTKDPSNRPSDARGVYDTLVSLIGGSDDVVVEARSDPTTPFKRPMAPSSRPRPAPRSTVVEPIPSTEELLGRADELVDAGRCTQAVDLLDAALPHVHGRDHFRVTLLLATACFFGGDAVRALGAYREVHATLSGEPGQAEMTLRCRSQIAACLLDLGRVDDAVTEFRAVIDAEERLRGPHHREVLELREQLAVALASTGDRATALLEVRRLERDVGEMLGDADPLTVRVRAHATTMRVRGKGL